MARFLLQTFAPRPIWNNLTAVKPSAPRKTWIAMAMAISATAAVLWGCVDAYVGPGAGAKGPQVAAKAAPLTYRSITRLKGEMDPAMLAIANRHDIGRRADLWGRPIGWTTLNLDTVPDLGLDTEVAETAEEINELRSFSKLPIRPMRPFHLAAGSADRARALRCLSEAVYYESAREPLLGREAVAQVVLNRMRHPAYPKSVCAVVYQGSARATGCQFSFTCDGSLAYAPEAGLWRQAQEIAKRALDGHVVKAVGSATHYHASYVAPYWAPTLVKMKQVGLHIFYRWTGPWGEPGAFTGRYAGGEAYISPAVLGGIDRRTQGLDPSIDGTPGGRQVVLAVAGEVRTYNVADASSVTGEKTRVLGTLYAPRRKPSAAEIKEINASLAAMEGAPPAPATPAPLASDGQDGGAQQ
ncbi:cell wall hydrolase [Phenylobacterium sp.]|uniref:cell wall hydrolase n=1 Tax=Phenylobacterium sp. TaxID=1871053 RepID=UPI00286A165C|nr:cell wall hydrolase [Phenylobacterium sp.]